MSDLNVLGIDLASRSWKDNGSAIIRFTTGEKAAWKSVECGCIYWQEQSKRPTAAEMAQVIEQTVVKHDLAAVSLDGPQGWRDPAADPKRKGVGRVCEYEAKCQGKTGEYGKTYPQTQHGWIRFSIDVFEHLRKNGNAVIANDREQVAVEKLPDGKFWLLECFPTSTWKMSRLAALPGKYRVGKQHDLIAEYARSLQQRYELSGLAPWKGTHDDLQAIVAALPAVGLLQGPCQAVPGGIEGWNEIATENVPGHWVEGIIWDATLADEQLEKNLELPRALPKKKGTADLAESLEENPLLIDDRDDDAEHLLNRGKKLFQHLADKANAGQPVGIGYAQLIGFVHAREHFKDVANRGYLPSDTKHVLSFAQQITEESGGPVTLSRDGTKIDVGMDAFIWKKQHPHNRPPKAFEYASYSEQDWINLFPNGERRLVKSDECKAIISHGRLN